MYSLKVEEKNYQKIFNEIPLINGTYHYSELAIDYEREYFQNKLHPCSFLLCKDEKILGAMFFTLDKSGELSFFKKPIKVFWKESSASDDRFELYQILLSTLEQKLESKEIKTMKLAFDSHLFSGLEKFSPKVVNLYEAFIDLTSTEDVIKRGIRKSYRSLINWGNREMNFIRIDHDNADEKMFESFRLFHIEVSGKESRSKKTWGLQFEMVKNKKCFLELGFYQERLVSGVLVLFGDKEAFYGVAVNDRALMYEKKPIGHATIRRSITHAKELGLRSFNLGHVGPQFLSEKEAAIGKFKSGLASEIKLNTYFEVGLGDV